MKPFSKFTLFPQEVTQKINEELWNFQNSGFSYFELSHRSKYYAETNNSAIELIREYFQVPQSHKILFMVSDSVQSSFMFNLLPQNGQLSQSNYIVNGKRAQKAFKQASKFVFQGVKTNRLSSTEERCLNRGQKSIYTHYNIVEPYQGKQYPELQPLQGQVLICDISFAAIYRKVKVGNHGIVYFESQGGFSIPGVTIVFVHEKLIGRQRKDCPDLLNYALTLKMNSVINTPNTLTTLLLKYKLQFWMRNKMTQESNRNDLKQVSSEMAKEIMNRFPGIIQETICNDGTPVNFLGFKMRQTSTQSLDFEQFIRNCYIQDEQQKCRTCWVFIQLQNMIK